jgi:hypothetical protein
MQSAKAGLSTAVGLVIQFLALAFDSFPRVRSVFRARPARGSLSLACARENNHCAAGAARTAEPAAKRRRAGCPESREHAPGVAPPTAVREGMPGLVEQASVCVQRTRAHRARDPADVSVLPSPRLTGTRRARAKAELGAMNRAPTLLRARRALLWLLRAPITLRRQRTKGPRRGARGGSRAIQCLHRAVESTEPGL